METITDCAIIWHGTLYTLPRPARHSDVIKRINEVTGDVDIVGYQGFMTSWDHFVCRKSGAQIALASGQIRQNKTFLFSEDMW